MLNKIELDTKLRERFAVILSMSGYTESAKALRGNMASTGDIFDTARACIEEIVEYVFSEIKPSQALAPPTREEFCRKAKELRQRDSNVEDDMHDLYRWLFVTGNRVAGGVKVTNMISRAGLIDILRGSIVDCLIKHGETSLSDRIKAEMLLDPAMYSTTAAIRESFEFTARKLFEANLIAECSPPTEKELADAVDLLVGSKPLSLNQRQEAGWVIQRHFEALANQE